MKSYREIADSVFARREQYVIAQRKKKQLVTRVTASVGSVALVSLAGIALLRSDAFRETPPLSDGGATTTTTHIPTEKDSTTTTTASTTASTAPTTTDGGIVTPPTTAPTTASTSSKPTTTQTPPTTSQSTTEPSKTTTTTVPKKVLIAADKPDNTGNFNETEMSINKRYISRRLKEMMTYYEGEDYYKGGDIVVYAVIVSMPMMREYGEGFWSSNEEWVQLLEEIDVTYDAWYEEARRVNPSWDGNDSREIETWTDTMRANYERWSMLVDERESIQYKHYRPYIQTFLDRQFETLKEVSSTEPVDVLENSYFTNNAYYVELTADAINTLVERGGYTFSLAMANQTDYSGYWIGVE